MQRLEGEALVLRHEAAQAAAQRQDLAALSSGMDAALAAALQPPQSQHQQGGSGGGGGAAGPAAAAAAGEEELQLLLQAELRELLHLALPQQQQAHAAAGSGGSLGGQPHPGEREFAAFKTVALQSLALVRTLPRSRLQLKVGPHGVACNTLGPGPWRGSPERLAYVVRSLGAPSCSPSLLALLHDDEAALKATQSEAWALQ